MLPVIAILKDVAEKDNFILRLVADELGVDIKDIIDFDLSLFDTTKACLLGADNEFFTSGRLDDLGMVHASLTALIETLDTPDARGMTRVLAVFDNEETGSGTKQGAASPLLANMLERVTTSMGGNHEDFLRAVENRHSWCRPTMPTPSTPTMPRNMTPPTIRSWAGGP